MAVWAFLGDEWTAAGFRLAGVDAYTPGPGESANLFQRLTGSAAMLIITAEVAEEIPATLLDPVMEREQPLVLVIPDAAGRCQPDDLAATLRRQLGIGA